MSDHIIITGVSAFQKERLDSIGLNGHHNFVEYETGNLVDFKTLLRFKMANPGKITGIAVGKLNKMQKKAFEMVATCSMFVISGNVIRFYTYRGYVVGINDIIDRDIKKLDVMSIKHFKGISNMCCANVHVFTNSRMLFFKSATGFNNPKVISKQIVNRLDNEEEIMATFDHGTIPFTVDEGNNNMKMWFMEIIKPEDFYTHDNYDLNPSDIDE